jgi:hypothetical protein
MLPAFLVPRPWNSNLVTPVLNGELTANGTMKNKLFAVLALIILAVFNSHLSTARAQGTTAFRPAPIFFAPTAMNGNFMVSIQSELGETYIVSYANSLSSPSWQTLTNITGNGSVIIVTNSALSSPQRFYRLVQ